MEKFSEHNSLETNIQLGLVVRLNPYNLSLSEFIGSRSMLEAEGVIPDGTTWPEGYNDLRWTSDGFDYWLRRCRPEGAKGPRKAFINFDWWCLRWELTNSPSPAEMSIRIKMKELKSEIYRHSQAGMAEYYKLISAMSEARRDDKFQAFKSLVPGLTQKKRNRRPNNEGVKSEASHG